MSYWADPDLQKFGDEIIKKYCPERGIAKYGFIFKSGKAKIPAKSVKVPVLLRDLGGTEANFLVIVNESAWAELGREEKEPVILHEILHCQVKTKDDGTNVYEIVDHDFEDFHKTFELFPAWQSTIKLMLKEVEQRQKDRAKERTKLRKKG